MAYPRFSEMLRNRREQLGLTIEQAARVLKLKEQALIAFEEADFTSIPKSGYAQGMLSSYARYLGLNPREVVDQFQEDLYEHTNGVMSHELRRRTRDGVHGRGPMEGSSYELPIVGRRSSNSNLPEPPHLLPENPLLGRTGSFETTSQARSRSELYQQGSPATRSYDATSTNMMSQSRDSYPQGRPYTSSSASSAYTSPRRSSRRSRNTSNSQESQARAITPRTGDVVSRRPSTNQYTDDLRIENNARRYETASSRQGRHSYRNIASTNRPLVKRNDELNRRQLRNRRSNTVPQEPGIIGFLSYFFSDRVRAIATILIALAVLLIILVSTAVRSCASRVTDDKKTVAISTATPAASSTAAASTTATTEAEPATTTAAPITETVVKVSVEDGAVTWLEITNDGTSEVVQTVTGPWSKTYTVTKEITIQVNDTSAVNVTKNGENVRFDERASGVGSITIQGTNPQAATTDAADNGTDANENKSAEGSSKDSKNSSSSSNSSSSNR
ncbi:helix-turn-helix domain-containing protein [Atopobium fossor]|uniref:helix-turn-helix domain-containing protein n=1 Tax=Atopobium fossor TaxID=39487 RepID=UPI000424037D|nr:helix-turn-helix transcriptional regulator [Atopobium fossor]